MWCSRAEPRRCAVPSMKVPPKRKGNSGVSSRSGRVQSPSMKVPPKRKGNLCPLCSPSMKVPPKRKGNHTERDGKALDKLALNESPSEKEGKYILLSHWLRSFTTLNESPSEKEGKSAKA